MKIVGISKVDFKKDNGDHIKGCKFHCQYDIGKHGFGMACESVFVTDEKLGEEMAAFTKISDAVGCDLEVQYNKYGKVASASIN